MNLKPYAVNLEPKDIDALKHLAELQDLPHTVLARVIIKRGIRSETARLEREEVGRSRK
ncbi:hypothetical protein [Methanomassiliicoccus luminyensis]|uniref:hypothetical protein n=1 Tax=Methanomassiliicoccus luminyensis TaxID=1080712 RepID=UPI0012DF19F9|nr:hypothetical protein [Methanomassiliicoccus luminyensis]